MVQLSQNRQDDAAIAQYYAAIVESTHDAIITEDLTGKILSWNPAAERIFGYAAPEIIGKSISVLIPEGREDEEPNILSRLRKGERIDPYETVRRRKDGSSVDISLTVSPIKNTDGQIVGASKIARDISERNRDDALKLHFAAIVQSSDDAILSKDLNGIIKSWNAGAQRIFGYTADEVIGKSVTILIPEGHQNEEPEILSRLRRGEKIDNYETVRQRKDGTLLNISLTVSPIKDRSGKVIGASKIARDITEQKRTQAAVQEARHALQVLNQELDQRVRERTNLLNNAVAQMEEFSYSVSHDLRSPARAMRAYASAVLEEQADVLSKASIEYLQRIIRSSERMDKLILDLLTFSRIAQAPIELGTVEPEQIIRDIIQQYPDMQPPRAEIVVRSPLLKVTAHDASFMQAVSNLLSNAVKFVSPGTVPHIEISSERRGEMIRIKITDNGIGIAPEFHSRLFGMFERIDNNKRYPGTGIGLAIVRKAAERMHGTVGLESQGTKGTTFWIELPAASG